MRYQIYCGGDKCRICNDGDTTFFIQGAKDDTILTISYNSSTKKITYNLSNISEKTQYLINEGRLYICLFVEEYRVLNSPKRNPYACRSKMSINQHPKRKHTEYVSLVTGHSGTIAINTYGAWSDTLEWKFYVSSHIQDPVIYQGTEQICAGISNGWGGRPYKMSNKITITVDTDH